MPKSPEPTQHYVEELRTHLKGIWEKAHSNWRTRVDPWYWAGDERLQPRIWPKEFEGRSTYIPSTARAIIDHASDTQLAFTPKVTRPTIGTGITAREEADAVERALRAIMLNAALHDSNLAWKQHGKYIAAYGYGVLNGPVLDMRTRPEKPERDDYDDEDEYNLAVIDWKNARRSWNPVRIYCPHPARVLMDPTERNPTQAVIPARMYRHKVAQILEHKRRLGGKRDVISAKNFPDKMGKAFELIDVIEYWDEDWHCMIGPSVNGANSILFVERNAGGFVPYVHCFAGFGQEITDQNNIDPYYLAQGLLDAVHQDLKVEAQTESALRNAIIERSYEQAAVDPSVADPEEIQRSLGDETKILEVNPQAIGFVQHHPFERWQFQALDVSQRHIQDGTFSKALAGLRQQGVNTVGQQVILDSAASNKFAPVTEQLNLNATTIGMNILKLVRRLEEDISAGGYTLKWRHIRDDYSVKVEFPHIDQAMDLAMRELGLQEVDRKLISDQTYREEYRKDPDETREQKRLIRQAMRQNPVLAERMALEVAREDGIDVLLREAEESQGGPVLFGPDGQSIIGGGRSSGLTPEAGGNGVRALRQPLTGGGVNPPRFRPASAANQ